MVESWSRSEREHAVMPVTRVDAPEVERIVAREVGAESWAAAPYLAARYPARSRPFTHDDTLWLVALSRHPDPWPQVAWLAGVLGDRGWPSWLLEQHLDRLASGLTTAVPERATRYRRLSACAARLRALRLRALPDWDAVVAELRAAGDDPLDLAPIVASAIADGRTGLSPSAAASVAAWLGEADLHPGLVAAARYQMTSGHDVPASRGPANR